MSLFKSNKKHILIVDDEALIVEATTEFLHEEGFETSSAKTAVEALQQLGKNPVDVMLLDIKLPDEDGLVFLQKVKKQYPQLPIVILTGSGYDETLMKTALDNGASGYVSKGTDMENMVIAIKRLLK